MRTNAISSFDYVPRLVAEVVFSHLFLDSKLLSCRMLELGANVNHADVHNTTPLMDLVSLGDEERVLSELARLERSGRYCAR